MFLVAFWLESLYDKLKYRKIREMRMKRRIAALMLTLLAVLGVGGAIANAATTGEYQVGYAKMDINPYVDENDHSKGLMALPMAGNSYNAQRLSEPGKLDDTGDGKIDDRDGIFATCIAITDPSGNTMLIISADFSGSNGNLVTDLRIAISQKYPQIDPTRVMFTASHTHSSVDLECSGLPEKSAAQLEEYNRRLRVNLLRMVDEAMADRAAATMHKGQIEANDSKASKQPIGDTINKYRPANDKVTVLPAEDYPTRVYNSVRHYAISIYPAKRTVLKKQSGNKMVYYSYPKDANGNYIPDLTKEPVTYIRGANFNPSGEVGSTSAIVYYADGNGDQIATTKEEADAWSAETGKTAYWLADMSVVASKENVSEGDDTLLALEFRFRDTTRKPIVLINWRAHTTLNRYVSDDAEELKAQGKYQDLGFYTSYYQISGDWVNAMRFVLEEEGYRPAFVQGAAGNMVAGGAASGPNGNWVGYATETDRTHFRNEGNIYGTEMAEVALECLREHMVQINTAGGDIRSKQIVYQTQKQDIEPGMFLAAHIYKNAYKPAAPLGTRPYNVVYWLDANGVPLIDKATGRSQVDDTTGMALIQTDAQGNTVTDAEGNPLCYVDQDGAPVQGVTRIAEVQKIASIHHANSVISKYKATSSTPGQLELNAFTIGTGFAMVTAPNELFDRYSTQATLETINQYNDWEKLWDPDTYGEPFMMGYANNSKGYIAYEIAWDYSKGVLSPLGKDIYAQGSYETQTGWFERGTGEKLIEVYGWMLDSIGEGSAEGTVRAYCQHCQKQTTWYPISTGVENSIVLTSGHYYADADVLSYTSIRAANNVCVDLRGRQAESELARFFYVNNGATLSIQDSQGGGCLTGTGYAPGSTQNGGVVYVDKGGTLNLYSGKLTNRLAEDRTIKNGGVVNVAGEFNMYGGSIENGTSNWAGGNVYVAAGATMRMYGGEIIGGEAYIEYTSCVVNRGQIILGGDARIENVRLWPGTGGPAMADSLTVDGKLTGKVCLFVEAAEDATDIGNLVNGGTYAPENLYFSGNSSVPYINGTDIVLGSPKAAAIYGEQGFEGYADTVQTAIDACQGTDKTVVLQRENAESNTVSRDLCMDLNGFGSANLLTVKAGATVYLKDTATDDLTGPFGHLAQVNGAVEAKEGYLLQTDEKGRVSAHAYTLGITSAVLRPRVAGVYYSGVLNVGDAVPVARKGIVLSVYNTCPVADGSDDTCLWTTDVNSVLVTNILSTGQSDAGNAVRSTLPIYARAYMELNDGTLLYGDTVVINLLDLVQTIDTRWDDLTDAQKQALQEMYAAFKTVMTPWQIPNLKKNFA